VGGALFNDGGTVTIANCTFSGNSAVGGAGGAGSTAALNGGKGNGSGGACYNRNGSLTIRSSTFTSNTADFGRGILNLGDGGAASVTMHNSILGQAVNGNSDYDGDAINGGSVTSSGTANLIRLNNGFAGTVISTADPQLGPLANNGGLTFTHLPGSGSSTIDAGNNSQAGAIDQRGATRIVNGTVDLGSVEVGATPPAAATFTSAAATTFLLGATGNFSVTTTGTPTATLSATGLPAGVTFTDNGDGTATLSGTLTSLGSFNVTIAAANGANAFQNFTLNVGALPVFTSAAATTFLGGAAGNFVVTTTTAGGISRFQVAGALPAGVSFVDNGLGAAMLTGTPTTAGTFHLVITASNITSLNLGMPGTVQSFTLTVRFDDVAVQLKGKRVARVQVTNAATNAVRAILTPFTGFKGRLRLQEIDVNGDGSADLVVSATINGRLRRRVYDAVTLARLA
jgi:hypothetical protein